MRGIAIAARRRLLARLLPTRPFSEHWAMDRGTPIDRPYIERFLLQWRTDIRGEVLEIGEDRYARRIGGDAVAAVHLLVPPAERRSAAGTLVVADLDTGEGVPDARFDACLVTQTLQFLRRPDLALGHLHRSLRPGGVLLLTVPGISQVGREADQRWGDRWRLTARGLHELAQVAFPGGQVSVAPSGDVRSASAFLLGLTAEECPPALDGPDDPAYPLIVTLRAVRAA